MPPFDQVNKDNLEDWYDSEDPWDYETTPDDTKRLEHIKLAVPNLEYTNSLDIGCGNGFITRNLPGSNVYGIDISENAISEARKKDQNPNHYYIEGSIFDLPNLNFPQMDLILITGTFYQFYLGKGLKLGMVLIDSLLKPGGVLVSSHIHEWYEFRFPYLTISREWFSYRNYYQILEVYNK